MKGTLLRAFDFSFLKYHSTMYGGSFERNTLIFCYCFYLHFYISITKNSLFTLTIFAFGVIFIAIHWFFFWGGRKIVYIYLAYRSSIIYSCNTTIEPKNLRIEVSLAPQNESQNGGFQQPEDYAQLKIGEKIPKKISTWSSEFALFECL